MKFRERAMHQMTEVALTTLFFLVWLGGLILFKNLTLEDYHIKPSRLTLALVESIVLAKVVLVLEHVPLGSWLRRHPRAIDVALRTTLYGLGAFVVLVLDKAFEARHESGGLRASLSRVFQHPDMPHVWANTLCIASALLVFNVLAVMRRLLGARTLLQVFFSPPSSDAAQSGAQHAAMSIRPMPETSALAKTSSAPPGPSALA